MPKPRSRYGFKAIPDSRMIDFDPSLFFALGTSIRPLFDVKGGQLIDAWASAIVDARNTIVNFVSNEEHRRIFPTTGARALAVLGIINALVPDVQPGTVVQNRSISEDEATNLELAIQALMVSFHEECARSYIVALEKQRAFDLHILVESVGTMFDPRIGARFSSFTEREIRESGRCLALERYTASGFHMLRAIEAEVRDCAMLLDQAKPPRRDLGDYIQMLKKHGADSRLISVLDNIRSIERNPLMHPEDVLRQDDAVSLFCVGQAALSRLIGEMEKHNLFPPLP